MTSPKITHIMTICAAFLIALPTFLHGQEDLTADQILETLTETMNPEQTQGIMTMTIVTSSGQERTFEYETYSKGQG